MSATLHRKRLGLKIGTALASGIIGIAQAPAALAQSLGDINNAGGATATVVSPTLLEINLNNASQQIIWNDLNVEAGHTLNFTTADGLNPYVALNTVVNGAPVSQILGAITSLDNIGVWLVNPQGMVFSGTSSFSGGSLVLSTLPPANGGEINDILANSGSIVLGDSSGNANAASLYPGVITINSGSSITSSGSVEMISQQITMNGAVNADGNVGLVLGHEVTIAAAAASPLRYSVGAGARLAASRLQVDGSISGANVELYAVSRDEVTGALLQVDSTAVITAEAANGSIFLYSEATAANNSENVLLDGDLNLSNATNATGKIDITADNNVTINGDLSTKDAGALVVDADAVTLGGAAPQTFDIGGNANITSTENEDLIAGAGLTITTGGNLTLTADGNATISSALSAGGTLDVTGDIVALGNGSTVRLQEAAGIVTVSASAGNVTVGAGMTLQSTGSTVTISALDSGADVIVNGRVESDGDLAITAEDDVLLATASGNNGYLISNSGAATIAATNGSIFRSGGGGDTLTTLRGIYGFDSDGDITLTANGDVHLTQITAGGSVSVTIDNALPAVSGALLGVPDSGSTTVQGGIVQAAGVVTLTTGGSNERVVLKEISGSDVTVTAEDLFVERLAITGAGNYTQSATNQFVGVLSQVANISRALTGRTPAVGNVVSTAATGAFDADYGEVQVSAGTGSVTIAAEKGVQLSSVSAGTFVNIAAGGVLADSVTSGTTTTVTANDGTLALGTVNSDGAMLLTKSNGATGTNGDELRLGTGTVTAGGATLDSKTSIRVGSLTVTSGLIDLSAADGDISGLITGTFGALSLVSTGAVLDSDYGSAALASDDSSITATALNGAVQLGNVSADTDFSVTAKALSLNNAGVGGAATLDATEGTLVLASLTAGLQANATKAGGSIAVGGDELRITTSFIGGVSGVSTGTSTNSSTHVRAGVVRDFSSTVDINATAGDIQINNQVRAIGDILIDAGRDVLITPYNSSTNDGRIWSQSGGIDITAGRSIYEVSNRANAATTLPVTPGVGSDYVVNGDITVQGVGNVLVGSITATGSISFDLVGGFYGTTGSSGSNVSGGALFAANTINVTAEGASGVNVLNRANSTTGDVNLYGNLIAIGSPDASSTNYFTETGVARTLPDADVYVGVINVTGPYILAPNDFTVYTNLIATEDTGGLPAYGPEKFESLLGKANLDAGLGINGTITGAAQLGTVVAGDASNLTVGALVADSFTVNNDSLDITATTGTLSLLGASVAGTMTLNKQGGSILTAGDDLRVLSASTGGSISLTSSTSIRAGSLGVGGLAISLTAANGDISGMRTGTAGALPTTSASTVLSAAYDAADLTSANDITVTATNGAIQLGDAQANGTITADARAFVADSLTANGLNGAIDVQSTLGSLNVDTTSSDTTTSLVKSGANGELRFNSITGQGVTLNSSTDVLGTTITASTTLVDIDATRDISVDTINAGTLDARAGRDGDFQTLTANGSAFVRADRDLTIDSLTSTTSSATTEAGRDLTVTTKIDGKTSASAWAAILDGTGKLDAVLITSDGSVTARSNNDASVTSLIGDTGASVIVTGDYSGTSIASSAGSIGFNTSGDVAIDTASAATGISGTVGSLHAISLATSGGDVSLTASTGDIAGKLSGTPGTLPTTTTGTALSSDYGKLNVTAPGLISLTAANGAMQLGTLDAGGNLNGSAKAITVDTAIADGNLDLTATGGTLYVGSGQAGLTLTLLKQGTDDELRFATLESGKLVGGLTGATSVTSSTNIRGTSITARGGSITATAADGEVTGLSGGRLELSALADLDGVGDPIALSDSSVIVRSGLLSRLGNIQAGTAISVTAGVFSSATLGGAINVLDVTSERASINLQVFNDGIATNGINYQDISGQGIFVYAEGIASGDINGQTSNGANLYTYSQTGSVTVTDQTSTGYIYVIAGGGDANANLLDAGTGVAYLSASNDAIAATVSSDANVYLQAGNDVDVGTATAGTILSGNADNDFALQSGTAEGFVELAADNDMLLGSINSNTSYVDLSAGGDITGANGFTGNAAQRPDITADTYINIVASGSVELDTATATTGNLTVQAGTAAIDGSIDINTAIAGGAIQLVATATGTAADGDHNGTVRVDSADAGTTLTLSNVLLGGEIGNVVVDTLADAGTDAFIDAAGNAQITSANAALTLAVRAGGAIEGTSPTGANLAAGEDLALKSGSGVDLNIATAGDDLIVESDNDITVAALTAGGAGPDLRSVSFASATSITTTAIEPNPGASVVVRSSSGSVNATGALTANNGSVTIDAADEAAVSGAVTAGVNYTVTAVNNITLGGASPVAQSAKGQVSVSSTSGSVSDGAGALTLTANSDGIGTEKLIINAPGGIQISQATLVGGTAKQSDVELTSGSGAIAVAGIDAARLIASASTGFTATSAISVGSAASGADAAAGPSTVDIKVSSGNITADDITAAGAGHDIRLAASGTISTGALDAARSVIVNGVTAGSASGAFSADSLSSTAGPIDIKASTITVNGTTSSAGALTLETTGGDLELADASSNGAMTLTASGALIATSLTSTGGGITGTGASVDISGVTDAGGALTLEATAGDLDLGDASSNGVMDLTASGALTASSLTSTGGGITGTGASVDISGAASAGGPLSLEATAGDLDLGSGSASGTIDLTASGKITTGALGAGGNGVTLTAADADITGAVTGSTIAVVNKGGAGNTFRIGDNPEGTGGFALDAAEVNQLGAATVTLDAGTGAGLTAQDIQIGDLALTNGAVQTFEINAMQRIDITGAVTKAAGSGMTALRIGGTATDTDLATVMRVAANGDGTAGLIDVGDAELELRAAKIGAGQDAGFLDLVGIGSNPAATPLDARLMVSNPASSLYSSTALGGTIYQPAGQVVIRANTMVVRYSDFALFQNTGLPGANEGVRLASAISPIAPALRIIGPASPVGGPFAMFGEINGVRDTATALLGDAVINITSIDRTAARINGCLIGSGAGCLTTLAISPILGTFDPVRGSIFFANGDFELPFDPLVGTNNDSLFGDVGTFGLEDVPLESIDCSDEKAGAQCAKPNGETK